MEARDEARAGYPQNRRSSADGSAEQRLGRAVDYLEDRLDGELGEPDIQGAAEAAGWSEWHFMRLFHVASGMTVADYVRSRRLSRAALALSGSGISVLEAAFDAGYESQAAFSRAFARRFGVSPSGYRRAFGGVSRSHNATTAPMVPGLVAPFEPRVPFEPPEPRVRVAELPSLCLLGRGVRASVRAYASFRELPLVWQDWFDRRLWREVPGLEPDRPVYGLCASSIESEFEYLICVEAPASGARAPGWKRIEVPAGRYAISSAEGPQPRAIQGATLAAYARWLPSSSLARGTGWDVEAYYPGEPERSELRIPIAPRARAREAPAQERVAAP